MKNNTYAFLFFKDIYKTWENATHSISSKVDEQKDLYNSDTTFIFFSINEVSNSNEVKIIFSNKY